MGGIQSQPHAAKALFAQRALTQESALRAELSWLANMVNAKLSFSSPASLPEMVREMMV